MVTACLAAAANARHRAGVGSLRASGSAGRGGLPPPPVSELSEQLASAAATRSK